MSSWHEQPAKMSCHGPICLMPFGLNERLSHQPILLNRFSRSNYLPSGHPVKGAPLRSASLRDGCAALDWAPAFGKLLRVSKRFSRNLFTVKSSRPNRLADWVLWRDGYVWAACGNLPSRSKPPRTHQAPAASVSRPSHPTTTTVDSLQLSKFRIGGAYRPLPDLERASLPRHASRAPQVFHRAALMPSKTPKGDFSAWAFLIVVNVHF